MTHNLISHTRIFLAILLMLFGISSHAETPLAGTITPAELSQRLKESRAPFILDVRTPEEFSAGHISGALNVPYDQLASRLEEMPKDKSTEIVVYCKSGRRAGIAEKILIEKNYTNVRDLTGHWQSWSALEK